MAKFLGILKKNAVALIAGGIITTGAVATPLVMDEPVLGVSVPDAQWVTVDQFTGYKTKQDASKLDTGANPNGQNTFINDGDKILVRDYGTELFPSDGTASTTISSVNSLHTFRKRNGENIMMRAQGSLVEWYEEGNDSWEYLKTGLTPSSTFGFADFNVNTDQYSYTYFGNAIDAAMRWTGNHTLINGGVTSTATSVIVDSTSGFPASGTIIYCGTEIAYSAKTPTTFLVVSAHACSDNEGVAEAVSTDANDPRGNIYLAADNRLFIAGVTSSSQSVFFSAYGDATDFSVQSLISSSTYSAPGIFNLVEGGGGVVGMAQDESGIYMFKNSIIYKAKLSDSLYTLSPLKGFDGKSQTNGAINQKTIFSSGNSIFFITPDNQIMALQRVEQVDYPQIVPISDVIKPTVDQMVFTSSTGIVYRDKAFFAARSSSDSAYNDTVLVWNIRKGAWESPIIGWNVLDWVVYNDGAGEDLYFGHALNPDVYHLTSTQLDNGFGFAANWRSKLYDFGLPTQQKEIENFYVEGYISDNTTLSISLLLDENGFTQTYTANLTGTETGFIYDSPEFNLFGFHPFGYERFGSSSNVSDRKKFRVYLNKNLRRVPFYNAQVEFASDGESQQWEILRFGFLVRPHSQPEKGSLYRSFQ